MTSVFLGTQLTLRTANSEMQSVSEEYVCPVCLRQLSAFTEALECNECRLSFPVVNDIPIFAKEPVSDCGTMTYAELENLARSCQEHGWDAGITSFLRKKDPRSADFWARYFIPELRAAGRLLLSPSPHAKLLDLGCGIGALSVNVARHVGEVVAVDRGMAQLQVLQMRVQENAVTNIRMVCAGDRRHLPFPDASFDTVLLNGVLEWAGTRRQGDPRDQQRHLLNEVRRILKPEGELYVGIENRIAFAYMVGMPDEHTNLRFVPFLPRMLANLISSIKTGKPYRTYTYSRWGYRKLLREAGFSAVRFYVPIPNYRHINRIMQGSVATEDFSIKPSLRTLKRHPLKAISYPYLGHSYVMVAGKKAVPRTLIEEAVEDLERWLTAHGAGHSTLQSGLVRVGETGVAIVSVKEKQGSRRLMLRIPLTPAATISQRRQYHLLQALSNALAPNGSLNNLLPQPVVVLQTNEQEIFVQRFCPGFDLRHCQAPQDRNNIVRLGMDFLRQLSAETGGEHRTYSAEALRAWVRTREEHLYAKASTIRKGSLNRLTQSALDGLCQHPPVYLWSHGDFWQGNLLSSAKGDRLTGVVDWEFADSNGMPLIDLLQLLLYTKGLSRGEGFTRTLVERLTAGQFADDERPFIEEYCRQFGISESIIWPLAFMAWLDWVYRRIEIHGYVPSWYRSEIEGFVAVVDRLPLESV